MALSPPAHLSFGATLGILLGTPHLLSPGGHRRGSLVMRGVRSLGRAAAAVLAATACAELSLGPIGASLFGRVTFAGLLLNFVAIPLMTVVQVAGVSSLRVPETWDRGARGRGCANAASVWSNRPGRRLAPGYRRG